MSNRNSILALAAVSTLVAAAFLPASASAMRGFGGGAFAARGVGGGLASRAPGGHAFAAGNPGRGVTRVASVGPIAPLGHVSSSGERRRGGRHLGRVCLERCSPPVIGPPVIDPPTGSPPCLHHCGPKLPPPIAKLHHPHPWYVEWHHPHWGVVGYGVPVPEPVAVDPVGTEAAAPGPCTCLTKRYLDDGSVLFADICTKEEALATPDELKAQARGVAPRASAP